MSDQTKVYEFIQANLGATTKAVRKGAGVRNERVTEILAAGTASGDLIMTAGFWGSRSYTLGTQKPEPETPIQIPVPEPQNLVPAAQPIALDLGYALLQPGPAFCGSQRPRSATNPEPAPEPWLVELQRTCRSAAEQGIRNAMAQMPEQAKEPKPEEKPVDPVAEGLLREIKSGAHRQTNPNIFSVR